MSLKSETYFAMIPQWILYADISSHAVRLYGVLNRKAYNETNIAVPGRAYLSEKMHCSKATVDRAMRELVALGAVEVTHRREPGRKERATNRYLLRTSRKGGAAGDDKREKGGAAGDDTEDRGLSRVVLPGGATRGDVYREEHTEKSNSPSDYSAKAEPTRKPTEAEAIAQGWIVKAKKYFSRGDDSLVESYAAALEKAWIEAGGTDTADPFTTGRAVLAAFLEHKLERAPTPGEWKLLTKLVKGFGKASIFGLDAGLEKCPDDWYAYSRAVCKSELEKEAVA
jgi:hypothetical protein